MDVMAAVVAMAVVLAAVSVSWAGDVPRPATPKAAKRLDEWVVFGPGGGGAQFHPLWSPVDPKLALNATDMSEGFITEDGGETWRQFTLRGHVRWFAFDPTNRDVMYCRTRGLYRSVDGGKTWALVHPAPSNIEGIAVLGDHAVEVYVTKDGKYELADALAVDPEDGKTLHAVMRSGGKIHYAISSDWGATWTLGEQMPSMREYSDPLSYGKWLIYVDPWSPKGDRTLYVIGENTVSAREGGKWTHNEGPAEGARFIDGQMGFLPEGGKPVIYVTTEAAWEGERIVGGAWASRDGGKTWEQNNAAFEEWAVAGKGAPRFRAVGTCVNNPEVAYLGYRDLRAEETGDEMVFGIAKTTDGGRTWKIATRETPSKADPAVKDAWLTERFGPEWGESPLCIAVSPLDANVFLATDDGRTMRSTDGCKTLEGVYSRRMPNGDWTTTGLDMTSSYGIHFDPFDPMHCFISYTDIGLMESHDGGVSWRSATANGIPHLWVNTTYWIVFDPEVRGRAWAGMTRIHDLPWPKMWRHISVEDYNGGVVMTEDGTKTWKVMDNGMPQTPVTDIVMDPKSPKEARTLYITGFGTGVWKSVDGAKSWKLKNNGIAGKQPFTWRIMRDVKGTLYLVVARRSSDGRYGDEEDGALYRSTDGAETWERIALPERVTGPRGIAIDPRDTNRLYLATWGRYDATGDVDGGIWLSEDGGKNWRCIFDRQQHMYDVDFDPRNPDVLYSASMTFSVWRSEDRGETWKRVKGYNFKQANRVQPDPFNPDMIYVSTFGGSIWYGPAKGDPDAVEDIVTPEVHYDTYRRAKLVRVKAEEAKKM